MQQLQQNCYKQGMQCNDYDLQMTKYGGKYDGKNDKKQQEYRKC